MVPHVSRAQEQKFFIGTFPSLPQAHGVLLLRDVLIESPSVAITTNPNPQPLRARLSHRAVGLSRLDIPTAVPLDSKKQQS